MEERGERRMKKEYAVCFTSNDGKETNISGHYMMKESAEESARRHRKNGNKDVFVIVREVTEWKRAD